MKNIMMLKYDMVFSELQGNSCLKPADNLWSEDNSKTHTEIVLLEEILSPFSGSQFSLGFLHPSLDVSHEIMNGTHKSLLDLAGAKSRRYPLGMGELDCRNSAREMREQAYGLRVNAVGRV